MPLNLTCQQCGGAFVELKPRANRPRRYCSFVCSNAGRTQPIVERFWAKVNKTEACWVWTGQTDSDGYGRIKTSNRPRKRIRAHGFSWELHVGPIPNGLDVCHRCDNPPCVRPDHLFLGTTADNQADKVAKGRQARGERHASAKLTTAHVLAIRADRTTRQRDLASQYGVSIQLIAAIRARRVWKHL